MIYRKYCNTNSGLILVDILLALSLGALFVIIITQSSLSSRSLFEFAQERNRLLDIYENHSSEFDGMMPYEHRIITIDPTNLSESTTTMSATARWYGNERIETDITVTAEDTGQSIDFAAVRTYPFPSMNEAAGTSFCSADLTNQYSVGSYGYFHRSAESYLAERLSPTITPILLPFDPTYKLTDLEVRNGFAYIANDSSGSTDYDLLIADIRDPDAVDPYVTVNTGPGFAALTLGANRIYAAMTSRTAQLQIIKIAPYISGIWVENSYKLPLPYATATPALGSSIFFHNNLVYLGTEKWDGEEFTIIDVSDPAHPGRRGSVEIGSKVTDIYVRGDTAYVATAGEKQLRIIDVYDPEHPEEIDSFTASGWERQEGKTSSYFEDEFMLGRTSGGFNIKQDHELFSWATSTDPFEPIYSLDISGGVYGIVEDRSFIYLATRQLDKEFQILSKDLSTTTMKSISLPVAPQATTCDGDSLYILAATAPVIYKISFK